MGKCNSTGETGTVREECSQYWLMLHNISVGLTCCGVSLIMIEWKVQSSVDYCMDVKDWTRCRLGPRWTDWTENLMDLTTNLLILSMLFLWSKGIHLPCRALTWNYIHCCNLTFEVCNGTLRLAETLPLASHMWVLMYYARYLTASILHCAYSTVQWKKSTIEHFLNLTF